jgi:type VI secretion system protein ImpF
MSRFDNQLLATPSILDRLIDYEPQLSREPPVSRAKSLRLIKQSVRRDLEWLLNTRRTFSIPSDLPEVERSLLAFGLPDLTTYSARNPADQNRLRHTVEQVVETFEPRLEGVVVTLVPAADSERSVRFRIDARLKVDPAPEPVTYDTSFQLGTGEFTVTGT